MKLIEAKEINFDYSLDKKQNGFSIKDINLSINEKDFISILGPNGSGKTTLLKLIVKLLQPHQGELFFQGKNYKKYSAKDFYKSIAYVPQKFFCIFPYTVFEIVMMGRTPHLNKYGFEKQEDIDFVNDILNKLNIYKLRNKSINEISGGEVQRVIIARALAQDTPIITLDEPNSHLDLKHKYFIFELLKGLNENNKTIITISHDINLSISYSNRLIFMKNGEIKYDGNAENAIRKELIDEIFDIDIDIIERQSGNTKNKYILNKTPS